MHVVCLSRDGCVENIAGKELARGKGGKKGAGADEFALKSFGRWAYIIR